MSGGHVLLEEMDVTCQTSPIYPAVRAASGPGAGTLPAARPGQAAPRGPELTRWSAASPRWPWSPTLPLSSACWGPGGT